MATERLKQESSTDSSRTTGQGSIIFRKACRKHQEGELSSAELLYQQAVQADPSIYGAWRNLGALLRQRGLTQEARNCTEQALKLDSTDGSLWGNYGNVLRDQGLLEESCKAFREGLQRAPESKGLLQGLAITLNRLGEYPQVVGLLTPVVEKSLTHTDRGDNALAELLLELGNAHHALGEKHRALKRWRKAPTARKVRSGCSSG